MHSVELVSFVPVLIQRRLESLSRGPKAASACGPAWARFVHGVITRKH